jgi:phosphatidate cytidylyltransferase
MTIAVADISAYFVGKKFGVTKLAKNISPGKTIEGMFGGFVGVVLFAFIIDSFWQSPFVFAESRLRDFGLLFSVMLALIIAVLSVYGDIFESLLKRKANVKDSGNIIPGHGGLLDRMDGYLPTFPILVLMFHIYAFHMLHGNVVWHFYSILIEGFEAFGYYLDLRPVI